jgi:hypothetical protein
MVRSARRRQGHRGRAARCRLSSDEQTAGSLADIAGPPVQEAFSNFKGEAAGRFLEDPVGEEVAQPEYPPAVPGRRFEEAR